MYEMIEEEKLVLLEQNPRRITKDQFAKLIKSMKEDPKFFQARPCLVNLVDGIYTVYGGNQRLRAARQLKWKMIPCDVEPDLSKARMDARTIKDNKSYGEFDLDVLYANYDIDLLIDSGFTPEELTGEFDDLKDVEIEDVEPKEEKEKKAKECPKCGHTF